MTDPTPPPPIDVSGIDEPVPDDGHEAIRVAALGAIQTVWGEHLALVDALAATNTQLATAQQTVTDQQTALDALTQAVTDLQAAVAALTPPSTEGA